MPSTCAVAADDAAVAAALTAALEARGVTMPPGVDSPADAGRRSTRSTRWCVAPAGAPAGDRPRACGWERVLAEHDGIVDADPRRRRVGAGGRRPRRSADASDPAGHHHRRHHRRRPEPGPGRRRSSPAPAGRPPATWSCRSPSARDLRARAAPVAELAAHLVCSPEAVGLAGAELVAGARVVRAAQPPTARPAASASADPSCPTWFDDVAPRGRGSRRVTLMTASPRPNRRCPRAPVGSGPDRLVPLPVAAQARLGMGDITGMARRFDVPTYRAESAGGTSRSS